MRSNGSIELIESVELVGGTVLIWSKLKVIDVNWISLKLTEVNWIIWCSTINWTKRFNWRQLKSVKSIELDVLKWFNWR